MVSKESWRNRLLNRVRGTDRLVVWDHDRSTRSNSPQRVTHFEVTDPMEIQDLLDRIDIDRSASAKRCSCGGSPHFDFVRGKEVLASLSLHHGVRLRWRGKGPADAELTRTSCFEVCDWFKERGIHTPWRELNDEVGRSLAWQRRAIAIREILPEEFAERFLRLEGDDDVVGLFRSTREKRRTLASWILKILGCDNSSWDRMDDLTHANALATQVMPLLGPRPCGEALRQSVADDHDRDSCFGAARVLCFFGGWKNFSKASLNDSLPNLIRSAIRHPRRRNRQYLMWILSQLEGGDLPLRWVLSGKSQPESITPDQATEPRGQSHRRTLAPDEPVDASDKAYAAWLLAGMGAVDVRDAIEGLAVMAEGPDRTALRKALEALGS